jgi:hypothetical protein
MNSTSSYETKCKHMWSSTEILLVQMGGCCLSMPSRSEGKDNQREKKVDMHYTTYPKKIKIKRILIYMQQS